MNYVDVHAHLDLKEFNSDLDEVIIDCKKAGVKVIISNGIDVQSNRNVLELEKKYDLVRAALGFYPTDVIKISEKEFLNELKFIQQKKPVAIGEVGLDKKWADYNPEEKYPLQIERFKKIIDLAEKIDRPLIVHTRKAELDAIELLEGRKVRVNFHCFMGKKKLVQRIIDNKWSMSIPANAFKVTQFQEMIKMLPLSQILTETDSPYLSGTGARNTPANVVKTIEVIAKIKNMTVEEVTNQVFMNYQRFVA